MTSQEGTFSRERTAAAMHGTAEQLEVAEDILHRSAEESPDPRTTTRLHALGDEVTAQAHAIDQRADLLTGSDAEPRSDASRNATVAR
ncbi:hypothetical protein AB0G04_00890 [Actinoplanes sp. NPDC023801]|uniref:hypothetical protein n=1 Tax=Actinoplanes sp. NPDC023801 TaxID=3154595 RepID=UPI0033DEB29A